MANVVFSRRSVPYEIKMYDNGDSSITYAAFGDTRPILFRAPRIFVHIDGRRHEEGGVIEINPGPSEMFSISADMKLDDLALRIGLGYHPIHNVPIRTILIQNISTRPLDVEVEVWFPMSKQTAYAVVSSTDQISIASMDEVPEELALVSTTPKILEIESGGIEQVNSVIVHKIEQPLANSPDWGSLGKYHLSAPRDGHALVDGSPSYHLACDRLRVGEFFGVMAPYWFLRTLKDSAGFSGISYLVPSDSWANAISCVNAPTHLGSGNPTIDSVLGLLSPIEFYDNFEETSIQAALSRISRHTPSQVSYIVPPEDVTREQIVSLHEQVSQSNDLRVLIIPPGPDAFVPIHLWRGVEELLQSPLNKGRDKSVRRHCIVTQGGLTPVLLSAALAHDRVVIPDASPIEVAVLIETGEFSSVTLLGHSEEFEKAVRFAAKERGVDVSPVSIIRFRNIEAAIGEGHLEDEWMFAARRCVANAAISLFVINDAVPLRCLQEQFIISCRISGLEVPAHLEEGLDIGFLHKIAQAQPNLVIRSSTYPSSGPASLVLASLDSDRWQDAVLAASYAKAKKLPATFFRLEEKERSQALAFSRLLHRHGEVDGQSIREARKNLQLSWLPASTVRKLMLVAKNSITLFTPNTEIPWEFSSWAVEGRADRLVAQEYDIGRMTATHSKHSSAIVYRAILESYEPVSVSNTVLIVWDTGADGILGDYLEKLVAEVLGLGLRVDTLVPASRLERLLKNHGASTNWEIRDIASKDKFLAVCRSRSYSLMSISAHGGLSSGVSYLSLSGEELMGSEIPELSGHPIVLLNSCSSARTAFDYNARINNGFSVELISRGAFQVVAPTLPVTGPVAAGITSLLLNYGMTRSAARVVRRYKQLMAEGSELGPELGTSSYVSYGDPSASKFFEIDGFWEIEDVVEKVPKQVPVLRDLDGEVRWLREVLDFWRRHALMALDVAKKWGYSSASGILSRKTDLQEAGHLIDKTLEHLQEIEKQLEDAKSTVNGRFEVLLANIPGSDVTGPV